MFPGPENLGHPPTPAPSRLPLRRQRPSDRIGSIMGGDGSSGPERRRVTLPVASHPSWVNLCVPFSHLLCIFALPDNRFLRVQLSDADSECGQLQFNALFFHQSRNIFNTETPRMLVGLLVFTRQLRLPSDFIAQLWHQTNLHSNPPANLCSIHTNLLNSNYQLAHHCPYLSCPNGS